MAVSAFPYGSRMWLQATFKDALTNGLVDPTTITARIANPSGGLTVYSYGVDPELTKHGVGKYKAYVDCNASGQWTYRFEGGGAHVGANELAFTIRQSKFYP